VVLREPQAGRDEQRLVLGERPLRAADDEHVDVEELHELGVVARGHGLLDMSSVAPGLMASRRIFETQ
jgi:hypothetical protein